MTSKKRRRHTPDQIIRKLAEGNKLLASGQELDAVCRHLEVAESTWHRWIAQYGGMKASDAKRLKELEAENARLKKLVAIQALDRHLGRPGGGAQLHRRGVSRLRQQCRSPALFGWRGFGIRWDRASQRPRCVDSVGKFCLLAEFRPNALLTRRYPHEILITLTNCQQ